MMYINLANVDFFRKDIFDSVFGIEVIFSSGSRTFISYDTVEERDKAFEHYGSLLIKVTETL